MVPDLSVKKPDDWDTEIDGEWKPPQIRNEKCLSAPGCGEWQKPQIRNPKYKGKWVPPMIPNPAYKGVWKPAKIPNPNYFKDDNPFRSLSPFSAVGLELWSMSKRISFDNFLVVDSLRVANDFAAETWVVKSEAERLADPKARSVVDAVRDTYREKPVLVLLIGLVLTVPFLFCLWYVCRPSPKTHVDVRKKTDAPTPDDEPTKYDATKTAPVVQAPANAGEADEEAEEEMEDDLVQVPSSAGGDVGPTPKVPGGKADLESDSNEDDDIKEEARGILTCVGSIFLIFGAVAWGLLDFNTLGLTSLGSSGEEPSKTIQILGASITVIGTVMVILGLSLCALTPILLHRVRYKLRNRRLLGCLRVPLCGPDSNSRSDVTGTAISNTMPTQVDITGDHPFVPAQRVNPFTMGSGATGKHAVVAGPLQSANFLPFKCPNTLPTLVELEKLTTGGAQLLTVLGGRQLQDSKLGKEFSCSAAGGDSAISQLSNSTEHDSQETLNSAIPSTPELLPSLHPD
ncbi:unnamed protein product [Dicrocoelium dendriticum]|nr:unnamed protein product [Dicrocoelium dendriticum]